MRGTVDVTTPNRVPVALDDATTVHAGGVGQPVVVPVLDNDTDANHDPLTVASVTAVSGLLGGRAEVAPDRRHVTYHRGPLPLMSGVARFGYTVSDGHGGTASATVTVTVGNTAPVAVDDRAKTQATGDRSVLVDVLANDSDPDGDRLELAPTLPRAPDHGTVERTGDGYRYVPSPSFDGTDSFDYAVTDPYGGTSTATVTITVVQPHSDLVVVNRHLSQTTPYLFTRFAVSGIPDERHATATVTVRGLDVGSGSDGWAFQEETSAACGQWTSSDAGSTLTLVCHLAASDNGAQLGHFDPYADSITLVATADDFDALPQTLTVAH